MIDEQKKTKGEALISTVLFDNTCEVIHDRVNVRNNVGLDPNWKQRIDEDFSKRTKGDES